MNLPIIKGMLRTSLSGATVAWLSFICLSQSGCAGSGAGIVIYDYSTGENAGKIPMESFREMIRTEANPVGNFFTMTRESDQLVIRKRNSAGTEITKRSMPLVESVWHSPGWCALDDDGERLAYYDEDTKRLKLRNLKSGAVSNLPAPPIKSIVAMMLFDWVGSDTLVLLRELPDAGYSTEISRINIRDGTIRTYPIEISEWSHLSPNEKWILGRNRNSEERITVYHSSSFAQKTVISSPGPGFKIQSTLWGADSKWLYYSIWSVNDDKRMIYRQNLETKIQEELPLPTQKGFLLRGSLGQTIVASAAGNTWILDLNTRKWRSIGSSNGSVHGIRGTTRYAVTQ